MPILVIKDSKSCCIDANVVPRKGECGFATKCAVDFLEFLGYKRINLKTDQEDPILTLKASAKRDWDGEIVEEESPVDESQSNGHVEMPINRYKEW